MTLASQRKDDIAILWRNIRGMQAAYAPVASKRRPAPTLSLDAPKLVHEPLCGCACVTIMIALFVLSLTAVIVSLNS